TRRSGQRNPAGLSLGDGFLDGAPVPPRQLGVGGLAQPSQLPAGPWFGLSAKARAPRRTFFHRPGYRHRPIGSPPRYNVQVQSGPNDESGRSELARSRGGLMLSKRPAESRTGISALRAHQDHGGSKMVCFFL